MYTNFISPSHFLNAKKNTSLQKQFAEFFPFNFGINLQAQKSKLRESKFKKSQVAQGNGVY